MARGKATPKKHPGGRPLDDPKGGKKLLAFIVKVNEAELELANRLKDHLNITRGELVRMLIREKGRQVFGGG